MRDFPTTGARSLIDTYRRQLNALIRADSTTVIGTVVFLNLLRIVSTMVLTRLLDAEAYGVIGIVTSISVVFGLLSDIGVVAFVVRHEQGLDRKLLDEIWTIRLIRGLVLTILMALLAGPIATLMQKPELALPLAVGALTFLLDALGSMAVATALREGQVKRLSVIDLVASLFVFAASALLAWWWGSYWALLVTMLLGQALRALLSYALFANSARRLRFSGARLAELWRFARYITGSTIITLVLTQGDKIVLSRLFSLEALGLYVLAANLATAAVGLAASYTTRVLYPRFADCWRETPDMLNREFYRQRMTISAAYSIAVGGSIACAGLIVAILYDERYQAAALFFQLLSISTIFALNNQAINEVMIASGRQQFTFYANIVRLAFLALAIYPAFDRFGALGLVATIGSIEVVAQIYGWIMLHRAGLLQWRKEVALLLLAAVGFGVGLVVNDLGLALLR